MIKNWGNTEMRKDVIELFAGVGGFRVGLNDIYGFDEHGIAIENRNWNFVWSNQWEPSTKVQHAFECYKKRFNLHESEDKNNPLYWCNKNISTVPTNIIPNHTLLVGGFPCQDYSVARFLSGEKGIEGKKGVLFWDIARILKEKHTPFVLLENVDRLLKSPASQRGRDFGIMLRTFHDLGYNVEWRVINAAEYGCAQKRRRTFIFAWKKNLNYNSISQYTPFQIMYNEGIFARNFPIEQNQINRNKLNQDVDLRKYKDTVEMTENFKSQFYNTGVMIDGVVNTFESIPIIEPFISLREIREEREGLNEYFLTETQREKFEALRDGKRVPRERPNGETYIYSEGKMEFPDPLDSPGRTMLTSEASINRSTHVIKDWATDNLRFITPIEAEKLQSFPENWTNTGMPQKRRYFMMGNALVTQIINRLENTLSNIIENE